MKTKTSNFVDFLTDKFFISLTDLLKIIYFDNKD